MKKLMIIVAAAICAVFVGCKSIPEPATMYTTGYAFGTATGLVCNMTKIDDTSRNVVIDIINIVDGCVPQTNQTFEAAWTPIAKAHTDKLVAEGKIDAGQAIIIMAAFSTVTKGIDYLFNVRYPQARVYADLVEAATHGFCDGFLAVFKPADSFSSAATVPVDSGCYRYLLNTTKK